jgi:CheY-like chemotaxis protein
MNKLFRKVLLVDDDQVTNYLHNIVFSEMSIAERTIPLTNAPEALDYIQTNCADGNAAKEECPDLIVLDVNMQILNALEFLAELKEIQQGRLVHIAVVVVSSTTFRDVDAFEQYGVKGMIEKPLTEERLQLILGQRFNVRGAAG